MRRLILALVVAGALTGCQLIKTRAAFKVKFSAGWPPAVEFSTELEPATAVVDSSTARLSRRRP